MKKIILATGGTGGHIFPAKALAQAIFTDEHKQNYHLYLFTDRRDQPFQEDFNKMKQVTLLSAGVANKGKWRKLLAFLKLGFGTLQALYALLKIKPDIVVGFGGYSTVPTIMAARILYIPYAIHEQNAVLGLANRVVANGAKLIALSFPNTDKINSKNKEKLIWIGNPVRSDIAALYGQNYQPYQQNIATQKDKFKILITGGSQGAQIFAQILPQAIGLMDEKMRSHLQITQQSRKEDVAHLRQIYQTLNIAYEVHYFFDNIAQHLKHCHLLIARAGASTIAECTIAGVPSLLIPYPYAVDLHQNANANRLSDAAGAWTIPQCDFTAEWLAKRIEDFIYHPESLALAAKATQKLAKPQAAQNLKQAIMELI